MEGHANRIETAAPRAVDRGPRDGAAAIAVRRPLIEYLGAQAGRLIQRLVDGEADDSEPEASRGPADQDAGKPDAPATAAREASSQPPPPPVDYLRDPRPLRSRLESKVGRPVRLLSLAIHSGHASADVQDPRMPEHVDQYEFSGNGISDPTPVKLFGRRLTAEQLTKRTFDFTDVELGAIPKMVAEAPARTRIADGKVTHVICRRALPFSTDVRCRVYVRGGRKDGSVEHDGKGAAVRVFD